VTGTSPSTASATAISSSLLTPIMRALRS